jgi:hypothetical protein
MVVYFASAHQLASEDHAAQAAALAKPPLWPICDIMASIC